MSDTDIETESQPEAPATPTSTSAVPSSPSTSPVPSSRNLVEHLIERSPRVRKQLRVWAGIFASVLGLFLLMAALKDLRVFDPVFWPALALLVVATLIFGWVIGHARGTRYCRRWSEKQLEADKT